MFLRMPSVAADGVVMLIAAPFLVESSLNMILSIWYVACALAVGHELIPDLMRLLYGPLEMTGARRQWCAIT